MRADRLLGLVLSNAVRNRRRIFVSAIGVVAGIAAFVFFVGLAMGVRTVVLDIFPLEKVSVIAPKIRAAGVSLGKELTDETVEQIRQNPLVETAFPRLGIGFPVLGGARFEGQNLSLDFVGDGIDPLSVQNESWAELFQDFEGDAQRSGAAPTMCGPNNACPDQHYCDVETNTCQHRVPILVSRVLVELYNAQIAPTRGWPMIGTMEEFIVKRGGLKNMAVQMTLGRSAIGSGNVPLVRAPKPVQGVLIGISDRAVPIGISVPIGYVKRWNQEMLGEKAGSRYSSIEVRVNEKSDVGNFSAWVKNSMGLQVEDSDGEKFALVIAIVVGIFVLISFVIVAISAVNIAQNLFLQVSERKREIGIMRAVGAKRLDVRIMFLAEAGLIGFASGLVGIAIAYSGSRIVDWAASRYLPDFPFKPTTFFDFPWWIWISGMGFSMLFGVLGGIFPAHRAASMAPAKALSG